MFNWTLFFILIVICIPGLVVSAPSLIKNMINNPNVKPKNGKIMPSPQVLGIVMIVQSIIMAAIFAAIGTALKGKTGLGDPFLEALANGRSGLGQLFKDQLLPALTVGLGGVVIFIAAYYVVFRPRLDASNLEVIEKSRTSIGLFGRVLYGGVFEEVMTRWGLLTLFAWISTLLTGKMTNAGMWVAIIVAGIFFAILHAPSFLASGGKMTPFVFATMIWLNLWISLVCGWLFWHYGLVAAIITHMLVHLLWHPIDLYYNKARQQEITG